MPSRNVPLRALAFGVPHGESSGVRSVHSLSKLATHVSPATSGQYGDGTCTGNDKHSTHHTHS